MRADWLSEEISPPDGTDMAERSRRPAADTSFTQSHEGVLYVSLHNQ